MLATLPRSISLVVLNKPTPQRWQMLSYPG
jgi:hypothetical protein